MMTNFLRQSGSTNYIFIAVVVLLILIIAAFFLFEDKDEVASPSVVKPASQPIKEPELEIVEPVIKKVEEKPLIDAQLPSIEDSDSMLVELVKEHLSSQSQRLLADSNILQKIVLQIDNIAQGKIIYRHSPINAPNELFSITQNGNRLQMSAESMQRFDVYADTLSSVSMEKLRAIYEFFKPLLVEAYGELGYQHKI